MKIEPKSISAVIPTRGDVDTQHIVRYLLTYPEIEDVRVSVSDSVFGRFQAIEQAKHSIIYTQDDDCITDIRDLINCYLPGVIVNAMTPAHEHHYTRRATLIGFGAIFDREMVRCLDGWEHDDLFLRECDRVFTAQWPHMSLHVPIEHLPHANDAGRMWRQPEHVASRAAIYERIYAKTGIRA